MNKKVAFIIAFNNFQDQEYLIPKETLEKNGFLIETFSNKKGIAVGKFGHEVLIKSTLTEIKVDNFDAFVFIGGPGALENLNNESSYELIKKAYQANKVIGAICISPIILAQAGILEGKKATVWSSPLEKRPIEVLKEKGAEYLSQDCVIDEKIVTANGPQAAKVFANSLLEVLNKN